MARDLRVLMTADTVGGVLSYALDLCAAISRAGGQVLLLTLGPRQSDAPVALSCALPGVRWLHDEAKLEWMDDADDDVARSGELLLALERDFRPDVVHLNGYAHAALPFRAPILVAAHSCVLSWWQAVWGAPAPAQYDAYRARVQAGLRAADSVVAPSDTMLRALREHYLSDLAGRVIHNGAAPLAPGYARRAGICAAGRLWDPAKNCELLVRAARGLPWTVRMAGPEAAPGVRAVRPPDPRLPANVRLLGPLPREELALLFAESAVYVHPARYEPFGLCVLEAALAGCALVLADIPSLRELWDGAATFVPTHDERCLHDLLQRLWHEPWTLSALSQRARARAAEYGLRRFEQSYLALYAELASAAPSFTSQPSASVRA